MNVHGWICALHRACRHVRRAQHSAWMHKWCMRAMNCVLMCMCVNLCAPALQLSTLVSMRNAHSIRCVCVWILKRCIRKMCLRIRTCTLGSNSCILFAIVQVLNRFRKRSSTIEKDTMRENKWIRRMGWIRCDWPVKYILRMRVEWRPIGGQMCRSSADRVWTKCISRCRPSQRPINCLVSGLICSVICTWSTPGLHLCPPTRLYVACVYNSLYVLFEISSAFREPN